MNKKSKEIVIRVKGLNAEMVRAYAYLRDKTVTAVISGLVDGTITSDEVRSAYDSLEDARA